MKAAKEIEEKELEYKPIRSTLERAHTIHAIEENTGGRISQSVKITR